MEKQLPNLDDEFLDLKLNKYLPNFRNEHNAEYTIVFELISLFNAIEEKFAGKPDVEQNRYLLSAIVELDKLFQSAVLMFERGLPRSGNIIVRTILELSLNVVDIVKNKSHIQEKAVSNTYEIISTLNIMKQHKVYNFLSEEKIVELLNTYEPLVKDKKNRKHKPKELAEKHKFILEYLLYRMYCNDSHISLRALEENVVNAPEVVFVDKDFNIKDFNNSIFMLVTIAIISIPVLINDFFNDSQLNESYNCLLNNLKKNSRRYL